MRNNKLIPIILDKPRNLLFNMNAMAAYERVSGKSFFKLAETIMEINATDLLALLWSGLVHEDKTLTMEQVGTMIDSSNMTEIEQSLMASVSANNPDGSPSKNAETPQE